MFNLKNSKEVSRIKMESKRDREIYLFIYSFIDQENDIVVIRQSRLYVSYRTPAATANSEYDFAFHFCLYFLLSILK